MEEQELILSLIEGTNDLIHSVTPDGRFEFVNRAWLNALGYTDEEWGTMNLKDIIFPGQLKKHSEILGQILAGARIANIEVTFVTKDGSIIYVEGNMFPRTIDNKIVAATGFYRDITSRKENEDTLHEQRARTEFFVDLMVHDITNINQEIISTLDVLLLDSEFPDQLKDFVDEAITEVERSSNLVDNVRKISTLYSVTPKAKNYDLWTTIVEASKKVEKIFPEKEWLLNTNISENQYSVNADEYLIDVFYSLLHNSMKFDKKKEVEIEIHVSEIKHTPFIRIEIKDRGPGILDEDKETLFEKVTHRRESLGGLGLGLSLVKMVLDNYGAFISIEDRVPDDHSKGANFVILMRYDPVSDATMEVEKIMATVMIVDDDVFLHKVLTRILSIGGHKVLDQAYNGSEAIQKYVAMNPKPEIILMDHRMPIMNGTTATQELTQLNPSIKILFISADNTVEEEAIKAGAWAFLTKPIRSSGLFAAIEKCLGEG